MPCWAPPALRVAAMVCIYSCVPEKMLRLEQKQVVRCVEKNRNLYHENVMSAGLRASGSRRCDPATVAIGKIATKSVMCQL